MFVGIGEVRVVYLRLRMARLRTFLPRFFRAALPDLVFVNYI